MHVLAGEQDLAHGGNLDHPVASGEQRARADRPAGHQPPPRDQRAHAPSSGTRHQPVIIDRTPFTGPARITSASWTMTNPPIAAIVPKCTERAAWRPPKRSEERPVGKECVSTCRYRRS